MVATKLSSIAIIVISIIVGCIAFYVVSDLAKVQKKKQIETITSQLINFIIFIWLGKILVNFAIFIKDPLAVLAYPSNSSAFYLAVLGSALTLTYNAKRKQMNVLVFTHSFIQVFLVASFVYEFIQIAWHNNTYSIGYMVLLTTLLILFQLIRDRINPNTLTMIMLIGWSAGLIGLTFVQPFVTVFGYIMAPWFVGLFFISCFILLIGRGCRN